jgi:hypothetical protein
MSGNTSRDQSRRSDPLERIQDLRLSIIAILCLLAGIVLFLTQVQAAPSYKLKLPHATSAVTIQSVNQDNWREALHDLGLALLEIGGIGVIFEVFNRKAQRNALIKLTEDSSRNLGTSLGRTISEETIQAVIGDPRFVREVLTGSRRAHYLETFISANLDDTGRFLARRAASQLSAEEKLASFRVRYEARDQVSETNQEPCAKLIQSLISTVRPSPVFKFHFQIFPDEDAAKSIFEPDVFTWKYWLAPDEQAQTIYNSFRIEGVRVNNVELVTPDRLEPTNIHERPFSKRFEFPFTGEQAEQYLIEMTLTLPAPKAGGHVYFEPRKLAHGIDVCCDYSCSNYDVVVVETLRADNVEIYSLPARNPNVKGARSDDWVLPQATVAFVFLTRNDSGELE